MRRRVACVPSLAECSRLARRASVVPVWGEIPDDVDTPVSAWLKLDDGRDSFLLESVAGGEHVARYSFVGSRPHLVFESRGSDVTLRERAADGRISVRTFRARPDALSELQRLMKRFRAAPVPGLPRFFGGLVGYAGYNTVRLLERLPAHRNDPLAAPDLMFMLADTLAIFDHAQHKIILVANAVPGESSVAAAYRQAVSRIEEMAARLSRPAPARPRAARQRGVVAVRSNLSKAAFTRMVARAKAYIKAGDIIQVVLSQRFERPLQAAPVDVYRALRTLNPSPYMFLLRHGGMSLVGASPEMLVRCEEGQLETRPIAGTRSRGATPQEEARLVEQLRRSPKERAEHLMLVDLGRNDLGRVAQVGSVETPELMVVEKYSHVMHLVSSVTAKLRRGLTPFDVLRATFPAGTVAGAPKVRAMEIIAELEPDGRGPYAGAVGYVSFSGNLDTCITIRTVFIQDGRASVQAGAGIVADSDAGREYQETIHKARGCLAAIERAEAGTRP
ncbi:MAG: anthranilate synthase component I [Candidatus Omnitrophica bacterium]|nr:anthranilate synthase component I [Candidatus Omnitrophota bacterium]